MLRGSPFGGRTFANRTFFGFSPPYLAARMASWLDLSFPGSCMARGRLSVAGCLISGLLQQLRQVLTPTIAAKAS
jgi:hypothetical protein